MRAVDLVVLIRRDGRCQVITCCRFSCRSPFASLALVQRALHYKPHSRPSHAFCNTHSCLLKDFHRSCLFSLGRMFQSARKSLWNSLLMTPRCLSWQRSTMHGIHAFIYKQARSCSTKACQYCERNQVHTSFYLFYNACLTKLHVQWKVLKKRLVSAELGSRV